MSNGFFAMLAAWKLLNKPDIEEESDSEPDPKPEKCRRNRTAKQKTPAPEENGGCFSTVEFLLTAAILLVISVSCVKH